MLKIRPFKSQGSCDRKTGISVLSTEKPFFGVVESTEYSTSSVSMGSFHNMGQNLIAINANLTSFLLTAVKLSDTANDEMRNISWRFFSSQILQSHSLGVATLQHTDMECRVCISG